MQRIGIWEIDDDVVGVATYELEPGEAFFQVAPGHEALRFAMLDYAEEHLAAPGADGIEGRRHMQSGPNFRHDLTVVAVEPTGDYVAFCGMWLDRENRISYLEPVVIVGIRRCTTEGARTSFVGSLLPIYRSIGFRESFVSECWQRNLADFPLL